MLQNSDHTIFSTWEWVSTWWKYFGKNKQLKVLLAEENNKIIGIAPFMYSFSSRYGTRFAKLEFIGTPHSDYNDFLIVDKREECLKLFIDYLRRIPERWNFLWLIDMRSDSENINALSKLSKALKPTCVHSHILLPNSYDEFMSQLSHNMRRNIRKNAKDLREKFKVEFIDCSDSQSCNYGLHWLFVLHQKRWEKRGASGAFQDLQTRNFHTEIATLFSQKGWLGLFVLKLSDIPVAVSYGFKDQTKYYFYLQGLDPDSRFLKYAVGNQITAYTASKCIEDKLSEFDFMRGEDGYKDRWRAINEWNYQAVLPRGFIDDLQYSIYQSCKSIGAPFGRTLSKVLGKGLGV